MAHRIAKAMSCENSSVDSEYVYTQDYIITPPACTWSTHTGQWGYPDQFECVDGTYCSETDPSCCVAHGGRIRCPASAPFMCHNNYDCANSQASLLTLSAESATRGDALLCQERCCMVTEEARDLMPYARTALLHRMSDRIRSVMEAVVCWASLTSEPLLYCNRGCLRCHTRQTG
ncbi:unnamed protein product [Symbiodinium natans]|uniref:Uncharacterized protein n=1 Tax=Symbiodinium natans TaxID=878477 RepID=A0A812TTP5_9DINO|nr:unnamed protein product [Symbiodinium natans]